MFAELFSNFCHQNPERSFSFAGQVLPFCQRCTGLYVGAVAAALFLTSFGRRQRRPAPWPITLANILFLFAMGVFGFGLIETSPAGRFIVGALFGSALVMLSWPLVFARLAANQLQLWSGGDCVRYVVFLAAMLTVPVGLLRLDVAWLANVFAVVGLVGLVLILVLPNLLLAQLIVRASASRRRALAAAVVVICLIVPELLLITQL